MFAITYSTSLTYACSIGTEKCRSCGSKLWLNRLISTMEDRAPRCLQIAWQQLKASRDNCANEFRSVRLFRGELNAVARAHTREAFVLRQEMSIKTQG